MIGFFAGRLGRSPVPSNNEVSIEVVSSPKLYPSDENYSPKEPRNPIIKPQSKVVSSAKRPEEFEHLLEKYFNAAPYSLVQKLYFKRMDNIDKSAFGGIYNKGEWNSEQRKETDRAIFERALPVLQSGMYYIASGTLRFKNKDLPYEFLLSFSESNFNKDLKGKIPTKPKELNYLLSIKIDTSELDPKHKEVINSGGYDIYGIYYDGGRSFARLDSYSSDTMVALSDVQYYLIELPNVEETPGVIRFFNLKSLEWNDVSDQLLWRPLSSNEYLETKEAFYTN